MTYWGAEVHVQAFLFKGIKTYWAEGLRLHAVQTRQIHETAA